MSQRRTLWKEVFVEFFVAALAEGCVAALGWTMRKIWKWWRKRRKRDDE